MISKILVALAAILFLISATVKIESSRSVISTMVYFDITQSMNAVSNQKEVSRLEASKNLILNLIESLPCGNKLGLGLFSANETQALLAPVEVCEAKTELLAVTKNIRWQNIWLGDTHPKQGLISAMEFSNKVGSSLIFLSDFNVDPDNELILEDDDQKMPQSSGILVGIGGSSLVPIPKFDEDGKKLGYWTTGKSEIQSDPGMTRLMKLDRDSAVAVFESERQLSKLDKEVLEQLATKSGLQAIENPSSAQLQSKLLALNDAIQIKDIQPVNTILIIIALFLLLLAELDQRYGSKK